MFAFFFREAIRNLIISENQVKSMELPDPKTILSKMLFVLIFLSFRT